jgi:hypothetical protein
MTELPIMIWSPSTEAFIDKLSGAGVDREMLTMIVDVVGQPTVDGVLGAFMDNVCSKGS